MIVAATRLERHSTYFCCRRNDIVPVNSRLSVAALCFEATLDEAGPCFFVVVLDERRFFVADLDDAGACFLIVVLEDAAAATFFLCLASSSRSSLSVEDEVVLSDSVWLLSSVVIQQ